MKVSLIVTCYNRPQYLKRCLESIKNSNHEALQTILLVDDFSSNKETIDLINDFDIPGIEIIKAFSKTNLSIKGSLLFGCNVLYNNTDLFINLDSDAIVAKDFFNRLIELKKKFPGNLVTGFNCLTKNKDGSTRHHVTSEGKGWNKKKTVGGINLCFNKSQYTEWVRPALEKCLKKGGNWDQTACLISFDGYGKEVVCAVPSVCQHIGIESSMGHAAGGEPPDVADDFFYSRQADDQPTKENLWKSFEGEVVGDKFNITKVDGKLQLRNVSLVGADCVNLDRLLKAADISMQHIEFGAVQLFSSIKSNDSRVCPIEKIRTKEDYSHFIMKVMPRAIQTDFMLIIQHDGYVLNPLAWDPAWLEWDYIGAPWEWYSDGMQVGNGGFSLRSKKLMDIIADTPDFIPVNDHLNLHKEEDHCIARIYRKRLESEFGIKFAPLEVARKFSIEGYRSANKTWTNEFGFHGYGLTNIKP